MNRCQVHSSVKGFTLIELILAMSLLGLLTATTVAAWRVGVNAQEKVTRMADVSRRSSSVADFIIAQTGNVVPMRTRVTGRAGLSFNGTASSLMLVSRYSLAQRTRGGLVLAMYKVASEEGRGKLLYSERRLTSQKDLDQLLATGVGGGEGAAAAGQPLGESQWITMMDHLSSGQFVYFGKAQLDQEPNWAGSWDGSSGRLPQGVAFHFSDDQGAESEHSKTIAAEINSFENRDRPIPLYLY